jgi:hypothetical protein
VRGKCGIWWGFQDHQIYMRYMRRISQPPSNYRARAGTTCVLWYSRELPGSYSLFINGGVSGSRSFCMHSTENDQGGLNNYGIVINLLKTKTCFCHKFDIRSVLHFVFAFLPKFLACGFFPFNAIAFLFQAGGKFVFSLLVAGKLPNPVIIFKLL